MNLLPWPKVDFAKFGPIEAVPLSRIKKISGQNLARNWAIYDPKAADQWVKSLPASARSEVQGFMKKE